MATYLEKRQRHRRSNDLHAGRSNAVLQGRHGILDGGEGSGKPCEEDTVGRDEEELDECQGGRFVEGVEDGFGGCVRQG